jgi:UDP-3-O-[3-hydroxymyristoyl] glucosamine N-acyltransferase LpxD
MNIKTSKIANFLDLEVVGKDFILNGVGSLDNLSPNLMRFSNTVLPPAVFGRTNSSLFILDYLPTFIGNNSIIVVDNPKLCFAKIATEFFAVKNIGSFVGKNSVIDSTASIGKFVRIGNNCTIGKNVKIGDYTELKNNVVIADNVVIGKHCLLRSNCVIGEDGFGFAHEEDGTPIRLPHFGSVEIGDNVEIGNFSAISKGVFKNTLIHSHVKIDNLVHIAHNCEIGFRSLIIAHAEISGSVVVCDDCWVGAGCCTKQKIKIGNKALIGVGAVVVKDVSPDVTVVGNPAKEI